MDEIQKEVWDTVLDYTDLIIKGKVKEFLEYIHEDYSGWNDIAPMPVDKQSIVAELNNELPEEINEDYRLIPVKLNVQDNIAIVHYYLTILPLLNENFNSNSMKHYTDVLIKSGEKWLLIADHFGAKKCKKKRINNI